MRTASRTWIRAIMIIGVILSVSSCDFVNQLLGLNPPASATPASATPASATKDITSFSLESLSVTGTIDPGNRTISAVVPYGTDITHLIPVLTTNAASISVQGAPEISGTTVIDFTHPVSFTVTAADGSTDTWVVTITVQAPSHDASLSNAVLSDSLATTYTFVPAFDPTTYDYTGTPVILSNSGLTYTLALSTTDPHATITSVDEGAGEDPHAGSVYTLALPTYFDTVTIVVTAQDGVSTQTYTMAIRPSWMG